MIEILRKLINLSGPDKPRKQVAFATVPTMVSNKCAKIARCETAGSNIRK